MFAITKKYYWKQLENGLLLEPEKAGYYGDNINGYDGFDTKGEALSALMEVGGNCYVLVEEFRTPSLETPDCCDDIQLDEGGECLNCSL